MIKYFLVLSFCLLLSCSQSTTDKLADACADADKIVYYRFESDIGEYLVVGGLKLNEMIVNFVRNSVSDQETEQFKCGYDGKAEIFRGEETIMTLEFNLNEDCRHFAITFGDEIYFREITDKGVETLKSILPGS